uniref:Uncharacterized protein n=1 Tax=Amphimedon queenslandica TaxID=400682 RepID=A0A1X7UU24_AMPQE
YNEIRDISKGTFSGLARLQSLYLQHNHISDSSSLLHELSHCTSLEVLRLNNNKISSFETAASFPPLQSLYIGSNSISVLPSPVIRNCNKLKLIDLSNNTISELSDDSFNGCTQLKRIKLNDNKIKFIRNAFNNLTELQTLSWLYNSVSVSMALSYLRPTAL